MSFLTSFCDLPQKEQRNVPSVRRTISVWGTPSDFGRTSVYSGEGAGALCFSSPAMILLQRFTHAAQMNALFPTIWRGTPGAACGAPATICPTSPCDLPQNEQRKE